MKRDSRPGRYANITATLALVVALGGASYAAVLLQRDSERVHSNAVTSGAVQNLSLQSADLRTGQRAQGSASAAGSAIEGKIVNAANVAAAAAPPDSALVSFTVDFPSVPAHGCIIRLVTFEPSDWYQMPIWIDNYLPPGLVVTNLQGQSYGASLNVCNVTAGALDPASRTYNLLLVDRFSVQP
jgi:hypothetical protein